MKTTDWKNRYFKAHEEMSKIKYPNVFKDGFYTPCDMPKYKTANGLTKLICNYLLWCSHHATRIASSGRMIDSIQKQPSGTLLTVKKYIYGTTRKGTSDIKAIIKGRAVDIEIKIGNDKPSDFQLREQQLVRKAGGYYEFISTPEEFFLLYDRILSL
jgi:hypothetical protein